MKFLNFREIVVFADSFSLKILAPHLEVFDYLLQPFSLLLLLTQLTVDLFYLL